MDRAASDACPLMSSEFCEREKWAPSGVTARVVARKPHSGDFLCLRQQASNQPSSRSRVARGRRSSLPGGSAVARTGVSMVKEDADRRKIEFLLPWYAAGTLGRSDADRVEQELAGDIDLARRYSLVLEELAETIYRNQTLGEPSARVAEKLFAAIDAEEARAP